ncbi:MAG: hypothetical protein EZS28_023466 [Streblomastix strix]|uniref:Uncharacterized protein n=1 Tax=Streblomastix strix TaxID=222440 RepID=A0A5J4VEZ8_9EUKA|nr:MAG: hypothetical protein EZS28_023466 [Streblomastix strix]
MDRVLAEADLAVAVETEAKVDMVVGHFKTGRVTGRAQAAAFRISLFEQLAAHAQFLHLREPLVTEAAAVHPCETATGNVQSAKGIISQGASRALSATNPGLKNDNLHRMIGILFMHLSYKVKLSQQKIS